LLEIKKNYIKTIQFDQRQPLDSQKLGELIEMINEYLSFNKKKRRKNSKKEIMVAPSVSTEPSVAQTVKSNDLEQDNMNTRSV